MLKHNEWKQRKKIPDRSSKRTNIWHYMHHLRDLRQGNQTALLKNLIIMQMPFIPFYLTPLNSPYGSESTQRKTQRDLTLGNRPHQNSSICGQLSLCVKVCVCVCVSVPPGTCLQSTCVLSVLALISQPKTSNNWSPEEWLLFWLDWAWRDCWSNLYPKKRAEAYQGTQISHAWGFRVTRG